MKTLLALMLGIVIAVGLCYGLDVNLQTSSVTGILGMLLTIFSGGNHHHMS